METQSEHIQLNMKLLIKELQKQPKEFTRNDLIKVIKNKELKQVSLRHVALDGKVKELKVPINNIKYLERILTDGERVDGSSLFKGLIDTAKSDLYIVPEYKTAFIDPFDNEVLNIFCKYYDSEGNPAGFTPENILDKVHNRLKKQTGLELHCLGELEFYVMYDSEDTSFPVPLQRGYHESSPFVKSDEFINEVLKLVSQVTECVKYCHSEVGNIEYLQSDNQELVGKTCEQYEVEFLLAPVDEMAYYLTMAKWLIRTLAWKYGLNVTFAPKLEEGIAGNGLHFHTALFKDGNNIMRNGNSELSDEALKLIAGLCKYAPSLTAFGNTVASSYLRLVPHQEAPTKVCWSDCNRSALVRVPLGWVGADNLAMKVNPQQKDKLSDNPGKQTVELRSPDGSAHIHLTLAGITTAVLDGLNNPDAVDYAKNLYVTGNIHKDPEILKKLESLPANCYESSKRLLEQRDLYEKDSIFQPQVIDYVNRLLLTEDDRYLAEVLSNFSPSDKLVEGRKIMHRDIHRH